MELPPGRLLAACRDFRESQAALLTEGSLRPSAPSPRRGLRPRTHQSLLSSLQPRGLRGVHPLTWEEGRQVPVRRDSAHVSMGLSGPQEPADIPWSGILTTLSRWPEYLGGPCLPVLVFSLDAAIPPGENTPGGPLLPAGRPGLSRSCVCCQPLPCLSSSCPQSFQEFVLKGVHAALPNPNRGNGGLLGWMFITALVH